MPTYSPPKKGVAYVFYISLVGQANTKTFQTNPTLATNDVKLAIDDAAPVNITALPVVDADFTKRIKVSLSAAEMNGDRVTVIFSDVAGNEWCDLTVDIATTTKQNDDLATQASVNAIDGATPAEVWAYAPRTLTQTAAQVASVMEGNNLVIIEAVTFQATLTGIILPSGWDKLYFTIKRSTTSSDEDALVQILLSNPTIPSDGLLVLNQETVLLSQSSHGSLSVAGDAVTITLADDATLLLESSDSGIYDLKAIVDSASHLLTTGNAKISSTATSSI